MTTRRSKWAGVVIAGVTLAATVLSGAGAQAAPDLPAVPNVPGAGQAQPLAEVGPDGCEMTRTGEYQKAAPGAVGLDAAKLQEALTYADVQAGSESIKVFRNSCLIGEGANDPVFERVPRINFSQTKTVASLIAGIAVEKGYLDIDEPIGTYMPDGLGDAEHRAVTTRDALNMSTGIKMNWTKGLNFFTDVDRFREWLSSEMVHEPGTYYEYDQLTPSVVTYITQRAIQQNEPGVDYQAFAQRELFNKLGIPTSAYWWQREMSGNTPGYSQLFLRPLEFGRLGELMLNEGTYQGERIVPADYVEQMQGGGPANCGHSFYVWLNSCEPGDDQVTGSIFTRRADLNGVPWIASAPSDMYYSWGYHGQHTFVIPSLDMVVTRSGERPLDTAPGLARGDGDSVIAGEQKSGYHEFFRLLMAAVQDMPADADIKNSGPFTGPNNLNFDPDTYLYPMASGPGTYLGVGPETAEGCNRLGCQGESNDGYQRWIMDVPRTFPGVVGAEQRPNG